MSTSTAAWISVIACILITLIVLCAESHRKSKVMDRVGGAVAYKPKTKWQQVMEKYPPLTEFLYFGQKMTVVDIRGLMDYGDAGWDNGEMTCEYADSTGRIHKHTFTDDKHSDILLRIASKR